MFEKYTTEKAELFDDIMSHFFNRNFGMMSKSDFETYIFHLAIVYQKKHDPDHCSDYSFSKIMGISQSRVRNLKTKAELVYPTDKFDEVWIEQFLSYMNKASYDEKSGLVKLNIPDINVLTELRNFMEERNWYDEYQLNPKLFQCPLSMFVELCDALDSEQVGELSKENKTKLQELRIALSSEEQIIVDYFISGNIKQGLKLLEKNVSLEFLNALPEIIPGGKAIHLLLNVMIKSLLAKK